jgi:hypothetical protein
LAFKWTADNTRSKIPYPLAVWLSAIATCTSVNARWREYT